MFFNRLVRNIFVFLLGFVIAINIYYFAIAIQFGTQDDVEYIGFYRFFKNFEKMPRFEVFLESIKDFVNLTQEWTGWRGAVAVLTLGLSTIAEFSYYLTKAILCVLVDVIRILIWILGFFGVDVGTPIAQV